MYWHGTPGTQRLSPKWDKKNLNCYISIVENNAQKFEDWKFSVEKKLYEYLFIYLDF